MQMNGHKKARRDTKNKSVAWPFSSTSTRCLILVFLCAFSWLTSSVASAQGTIANKDPERARFETEIATFEKWDRQNAFPKDAILFVGSSSIRLWQTAEAFPDAPVINRGFGGSTIADANHYADRVVLKYKPRVIVFYSGDNDIAGGKPPHEVFDNFQEFVDRIHNELPEARILVLSIKPSIARQKFWPKMKETNALIAKLADEDSRLDYIDIATPMLAGAELPSADFFLDDGLHLNAKGYALWNKAVSPSLAPK
jgi:lysophospholipase L1-like esterase